LKGAAVVVFFAIVASTLPKIKATLRRPVLDCQYSNISNKGASRDFSALVANRSTIHG